MIRHRTASILAAAASACWLCSACSAPLTMTAANSVNPVMFGPVKTMGSGSAPRESSRVAGGTVFHHQERVWAIAAWDPVFGGYFLGILNFFGSPAVWTGPAGDDETGPDWTAIREEGGGNPARLDWKVFRATGENPARWVDLTSFWCGGFKSFWLLGRWAENNCILEGVVSTAE